MARITCNCKADHRGNSQSAEYQNKIYGTNVRIATPFKDKFGNTAFRCTICLRETTKGTN